MSQDYRDHSSGKLNKNCVDCGAKVSRLGTKRCKACDGKQQSIRQMGENNPYYRHGRTGKNTCIDCGTKVKLDYAKRCRPCAYKVNGENQRGKNNPKYKNGRHANGMEANCIDCGQVIWSCNTRCRTCWDMYNIGSRNPAWKGGVSFESYPVGWGRKLKELVRSRDGFKCRECGVPHIELGRKLDVHHIDYDKKNLSLDNLISLCHSCHAHLAHRPSWAVDKYKEAVKC